MYTVNLGCYLYHIFGFIGEIFKVVVVESYRVHTVYFLSCGLRGSDFYFWRIQFPDPVSKISQQLFRSNQFLTFFKDPLKHIHYMYKEV